MTMSIGWVMVIYLTFFISSLAGITFANIGEVQSEFVVSWWHLIMILIVIGIPAYCGYRIGKEAK